MTVDKVIAKIIWLTFFWPTLYKLFKPGGTSGVRQNFFTERVINPWNSLPPTVSFTSLSLFRQTICSVDFSGFVSCH